MCSAGGSLASLRADLYSAICPASSSGFAVGTSSQPSPIFAARLIAASTWAPTRIGGRDCSGRGPMRAAASCQRRAWGRECAGGAWVGAGARGHSLRVRAAAPGARAPRLGEGHADRGNFSRPIAGPDAEQNFPAADEIEERADLSELDGIVQRQQRDV